MPAWQRAGAVVAAYSIAALLVAFLTHAATARTFPEAARDLWSAAMIWALLTAAVYSLVRRWPVPRIGLRHAALLYVPVVLAASWIVNAAFMALYVATGLASAEDFSVRWHTLSLLNLPFNAAATVALVAVFHWLRASRADSATGVRPQSILPRQLVASISVSTGARRYNVPVATVELIEAADDYTVLHAADASHLCGKRLYRLEKELAPDGFLRVHRSALVNGACVVAMASRHGLVLELESGRTVTVSRRRQAAVKRALACSAAHSCNE